MIGGKDLSLLCVEENLRCNSSIDPPSPLLNQCGKMRRRVCQSYCPWQVHQSILMAMLVDYLKAHSPVFCQVHVLLKHALPSLVEAFVKLCQWFSLNCLPSESGKGARQHTLKSSHRFK